MSVTAGTNALSIGAACHDNSALECKHSFAYVQWMNWRKLLPKRLRVYLYRRASRTHPGLRGQLMWEWSRATGEPLPEEERQRIRSARDAKGTD